MRISDWSSDVCSYDLLRTPREQTWDAPRHVAALVEKLRPHIPSIKAVQQALGLEAEFVCILYIRNERPALHFDREILEVVDAINADIEIGRATCKRRGWQYG